MPKNGTTADPEKTIGDQMCPPMPLNDHLCPQMTREGLKNVSEKLRGAFF